MLGALLEAEVQPFHGFERVDLCSRLVRSQLDDPREAQREAGAVTIGTHDDVEGDLHHHGGLDLAIAPELGDRVRFEPARHLGNLGVRQSAVGLADVHQPTGRLVADGERVVR